MRALKIAPRRSRSVKAGVGIGRRCHGHAEDADHGGDRAEERQGQAPEPFPHHYGEAYDGGRFEQRAHVHRLSP